MMGCAISNAKGEQAGSSMVKPPCEAQYLSLRPVREIRASGEGIGGWSWECWPQHPHANVSNFCDIYGLN